MRKHFDHDQYGRIRMPSISEPLNRWEAVENLPVVTHTSNCQRVLPPLSNGYSPNPPGTFGQYGWPIMKVLFQILILTGVLAGIVFVAMMVVEMVMAFVGMILTIVVPCLYIFGGLWLFVTICSKN